MAASGLGRGSLLIALCLLLVLMPGRAEAFGAGNIPSIAQVLFNEPRPAENAVRKS